MITGCQICLDTDGILYTNNEYLERCREHSKTPIGKNDGGVGVDLMLYSSGSAGKLLTKWFHLPGIFRKTPIGLVGMSPSGISLELARPGTIAVLVHTTEKVILRNLLRIRFPYVLGGSGVRPFLFF